MAALLYSVCLSSWLFLTAAQGRWQFTHRFIWSDRECPAVGSFNIGLDACKSQCELTASCSAINVNIAGNDCVLRACRYVMGTGLVVPPTGLIPGWSGYAFQEIRDVPVIKNIIQNLHKGKVSLKEDVGKAEKIAKDVGSVIKGAFVTPAAGATLAKTLREDLHNAAKTLRDTATLPVNVAPPATSPPAPMPAPAIAAPSPTPSVPPPVPVAPPATSAPAPMPAPAIAAPSPTPSVPPPVPVPSPSPTPQAPTGSTMQPTRVPVLCASPPNQNSGCPTLFVGPSGHTLSSCIAKMNMVDGDTLNFKSMSGECNVNRCASADMEYRSTGTYEVYSTFCEESLLGGLNPLPPGSDLNDNVVSKFNDLHHKPEQALAVRAQKPWFLSALVTMLWLSVPCGIGMVVIYRKGFRSCRREETRDALFAFNVNEDEVIREPLHENDDLEALELLRPIE